MKIIAFLVLIILVWTLTILSIWALIKYIRKN